MPWLKLILFLGLLISPETIVAESKSRPRPCDEWNATYVSHSDDEGIRVYAEFGKSRGSEPMPFTLTGVDKTGTRVWRHKTRAWCYLGSGGCHVGLTVKGQEKPDSVYEQSHRIVFVRSSRTDTRSTPDILVLSGLGAAFLDSAKAGDANALAIDRFAGAPEVIIPPDVFYFERCHAD